MKKTVDLIDLCTKFNELRTSKLEERYSPEEMKDLCKQIGINERIFHELAKRNVFEKSKFGTKVVYRFSKNPLYKGLLEQTYNHIRQLNNISKNKKKSPVELNLTDEEQAIALLKSKGYRLIKPIGINVESLKKDLPNIYRKYVQEEEI